MNKPLVSIVIPVYNGSNYLRRAIDSALSQTYPNVEVIVVNDGSTDNGKTHEIAESYGDKIRYFCKENGGVSSALNVGIREMKGDFFSWLSHDDEYKPTKIEKQITELQSVKNPKMIALCGTEFIDEQSHKLNKRWRMPEAGVYSSEKAIIHLTEKVFSGIALLIPRRAFEENGMFDESLKYIQDVVMWRRILLSGYGLVVSQEVLSRSRLHGLQQTNNHREVFVQETERTALQFCDALCKNHNKDAAVTLWYMLLKEYPKSISAPIQEVLRDNGLLDWRVRLKGTIYNLYGEIRPLIRRAYYKVRFGIRSV